MGRLSLGALWPLRAQPRPSDMWRGSGALRWSDDETGREDGQAYDFQYPYRALLRRGRSKAVVAEALEEFAGALSLLRRLPSTAPSNAAGHTTCLRALYPDDVPLGRWADAVRAMPKPKLSPTRRNGSAAAANWPWNNVADLVPSLPRSACRRSSTSQTAVPPDNNAPSAARHLVVSRKVSGGTRSPQGTETDEACLRHWRAATLSPLGLISPQF